MKVRIVKRDGQAALVEWESTTGYRRAIVPADSVIEDDCPDEMLAAGIRVGVEWERYIHLQATPEKLANELRKRGIWKMEDLRANLIYARAAVIGAYEFDVAALLQIQEAK